MLRVNILKRTMSNILKDKESIEELVYIKKRELERLKECIKHQEELLQKIKEKENKKTQ